MLNPTKKRLLEVPEQNSPAMSIEQSIRQGAERMGIDIPDTAAAQLAGYVRLLARWNRVYNLTAVREPQAMVVRHILDSLSILPWLHGPRALDVGSGAGLPGIPLAIARLHSRFYLLDSNGKRPRFMTQAVAELGLSNVEVVHCRIQDYHPEVGFDSVLARAFAPLAMLLTSAGRLCREGGRLLAMKGERPDAELDELPAGFAIVGVYPLQVPGLEAKRHLIHFAAAALATDIPTAVSAATIFHG